MKVGSLSEWRLGHPYEVLSRNNSAGVLAKASAKLSPEAIASGYSAAGLHQFNVGLEAIHYTRLTSTNQRLFDERAFPVVRETDSQIALRCIENVVGPQVISAYKNMNRMNQPVDFPVVDAMTCGII